MRRTERIEAFVSSWPTPAFSPKGQADKFLSPCEVSAEVATGRLQLLNAVVTDFGSGKSND